MQLLRYQTGDHILCASKARMLALLLVVASVSTAAIASGFVAAVEMAIVLRRGIGSRCRVGTPQLPFGRSTGSFIGRHDVIRQTVRIAECRVEVAEKTGTIFYFP